jgi:hypothetical protein
MLVAGAHGEYNEASSEKHRKRATKHFIERELIGEKD